MEGTLFDGDEPMTREQIEWRLKKLRDAWNDCGTERLEDLKRVNEEILAVTRKLDCHPDWWVIPTCACRECQEWEREL